MGKCSIVFVILGSLLVVHSVSAQPFDTGNLGNVMTMITDRLKGLMGDKGGQIISAVTDRMKGIMEKIGGLFKGKGGGGGSGGAGEGARRKRSIQSSYTVTNMNKTNYHKVEINHSYEKDQEKQTQPQTNCLVKNNEIYWLEFMTTQLIHVLGEMKKVLDGKVIPYQMSKHAYNKTG